MARKKDERLVKQPYKEERKAKAAQKKTADGGAAEPYLQPNDDHFVSFKKQLTSMGLMLRDILGDGNCLFRALNDQLEGHSRNHLRLRHDTVRFMIEHREDFEPFVEDDVPFHTHVRQLSQPGTYGGHDALVAFARMSKVNIVIHQLNSPLWQIEGGPNGCPQLHLSYHNGEHYSSVRRAGDTSESAANVRIEITPSPVAGMSSNSADKKNRERRVVPWREASCADNVNDRVAQRISGRTGCTDFSMIREALMDNDGDERAATDYIASLMVATDSAIESMDEMDEVGEAVVGEPTTAAAASAPADGSVENSTSGRTSSGKAKPASTKKLTNKQRKEQNRRDKANQACSTAANDRKSLAENRMDQIDGALVTEAAFGCLRI